MNERMIILETLLLIDKENGFDNKIINQVLDKFSYLDKQERSFIKRVVEGTVERRLELDYIINCYSNTKINKCKPVIRALLRMSVYQLKYMDTVPESAVCNEAVKIASKKGFSTLKGFVNGVLRNIARNIENIEYPDINTIEGLSIRYSCPEWLVKQLVSEQGMDITEAILKDSLEAKPLYVRTNQSRISTDDLRRRFEAANLSYKKAPYLPYAFVLNNIDSLERIDAFNEGLFQVQDLSSMLVAELAGINPGDTVVDCCAAPGGKSMHALDILNGTGRVISCDVSEYKVNMIRDNVTRCGFTNSELMVADATVHNSQLDNTADVLIADLPCSGLGVIGRKNDIKYNISIDKEESLVKLQRQILENVSRYVKPGGIMMFSTCTIHRAENEDNVEWIEKNLDFTQVPIKDKLPDALAKRCRGGYIQLLPGMDRTDGFFVAKFIKKQ